MKHSMPAKNFQVYHIELIPQQTVKINTQENAIYQLYNHQKQRISPKKTMNKGKDLWVFAEETDTEPSLILEDYYQHLTILDEQELVQLGADFATTSALTPVNMPVSLASQTPSSSTIAKIAGEFSTAEKIGLGVFGVFGAGVAFAGKDDTNVSVDNEVFKKAQADKLKAEQEKAQAEADKQKAEAEKTRLENALNEANTAKTQLENDLSQVQETLKNTSGDLQKALDDKKALEEKLKIAEQNNGDVTDLQNQLTQANQAIKEKQTALDNALAEKETLQKQLAEKTNDLTKLQEQLKTVQEQLNKETADKAQAEADKQEAEAEKTRLENALNEANTAKTQLENDLSQVQETLKNTNSDLQKALDDKKALEEKLKIAEQNNGDVTDLQNQLTQANQTIKEKQTALDNALAEKETLQTQLNEKTNDLTKLQEQLKTVQEQLNKETADKAQAEAEKVEVEAEKTRLENALNEANTTKTQLENNLSQVQETLKNTNSELQKALDDKKALEEKLKIAEQNNGDVADLQNQLTQANATIAEKQTALDNALAEKETLQAQLNEKNTALTNLQSQLNTVQEQLNKALADKAQAIKDNPPQIKFNKIGDDDVLNQTESQGDVKISGSVTNLQTGDVLTIKIGETSHTVTVTKGEFELTISGAVLQNTPALSAQVLRNGEKVAETSHTYKVDTDIATPTIKFNHITDDNTINANEAREKAIEITGQVTNFNAGEQLLVSIGNEPPKRVAVQNDGTFSFWVAGETLAQKPSIQATLTTTDDAGNTATTMATADYTVDMTPPTPQAILTLEKITGDNHINVSEKLQETNSIIGKVTGTHLDSLKGKAVQMTVNGKNLTATIGDDLQFEFKAQGEDLIKHKDYKLVATLDNNGTMVKSAEKSYTVAPEAIAKIHLNDVNLDLAEEIGRVRLSGKLDLADTLFAQGKNGNLIRAVVLKIGEKEFSVAVKADSHTFELDLTRAEYEALKGQPITHEVKYYNDTYSYVNKIGFPYTEKPDWYYVVKTIDTADNLVTTEASKIRLVFDDTNVQANHQLQLTSEAKTLVTGVAEGAKEGDTVVVNVGGKTYNTQVENDLRFEVKVDNQDLGVNTQITAKLETKDINDEIVNVMDVATVLQKTNVADTFVNPHANIAPNDRVVQHTNENYNFPYFVHAIDLNTQQGFLNYNKTPFGVHNQATPVIKYYFATQQDYDNGVANQFRDIAVAGSHAELSAEMKNHLTYVYDTFAKVTNLKFEKTDNKDEANTILMTAKFNGGASGFAYFGGNAMFNSDYGDGSEFKKYINFHEIFHTLGAGHVDTDAKDFFRTHSYANAEATTETSMMSYNYNFSTNSGRNDVNLYDLAYLHYRFGVNKDHNAGDNVYRFNAYNPMLMDGNVYIWDGAGVDTFDASKEAAGVAVNLTPGSWIYRGEKSDTFLIKDRITTNYNSHEQIRKYFPEHGDNAEFYGAYFRQAQNVYTEGQAFIGYGTQIENLIGSAHADVLHGNKANNNIYGGDGNDTIDGDEGNDYLDGGNGVDTLRGGLGDDIFVVDETTDTVIELADVGHGTDTVYSHALTYTLSDNVENVSLFGLAQNATGNGLSNIMLGNDLNNQLFGGLGDDTLNGGRGSDFLVGGAGKDTFVFSDVLDGSIDTINDFSVSDDIIALSSKIFDALTNTNIKDHIKYDSQTGALSYDKDGTTGEIDAVQFAMIGAGLNETQIVYQIIG